MVWEIFKEISGEAFGGVSEVISRKMSAEIAETTILVEFLYYGKIFWWNPLKKYVERNFAEANLAAFFREPMKKFLIKEWFFWKNLCKNTWKNWITLCGIHNSFFNQDFKCLLQKLLRKFLEKFQCEVRKNRRINVY